MSRYRVNRKCLVVLCLGFLGCEMPPADVQSRSNTSGDPDVDEEGPMRGFSWVIDGQLAGMPKLGLRQSLEEDIVFLAEQGIDVLVSLTVEPTPEFRLQAHGIRRFHWPIEDFSAPTMEQMVAFAIVVRRQLDAGHAVGIHCTAGLGRTGTMIAVYFVSTGMTALEAIVETRTRRPGSIETASQEAAIAAFAELLIVQPNTLI